MDKSWPIYRWKEAVTLAGWYGSCGLSDPRLDIAAAVVNPPHHFYEDRSVSLVPQRRPRLGSRAFKQCGHGFGGDQLVFPVISELSNNGHQSYLAIGFGVIKLIT